MTLADEQFQAVGMSLHLRKQDSYTEYTQYFAIIIAHMLIH